MDSDQDDTVTLWRPTGPEELELVRSSGGRRWPPRLPGQLIFYTVLNQDNAAKIARDWNVPRSTSSSAFSDAGERPSRTSQAQIRTKIR
jgi:hypothetical protein